MPNVTAPPFILDQPLISLGATGSEVQIQCGATNLEVAVDQDENTVETFCGSYTSYKAPKWTITVTLAQSYGADGTWTLIQPMCGTIVPFQLQPNTTAASVDNPNMSGTVLVKQLPFISGAPGEASEIDLELAVQGDPVFGITAPVVAAATEEAA
jgi:hypothetical protein